MKNLFVILSVLLVAPVFAEDAAEENTPQLSEKLTYTSPLNAAFELYYIPSRFAEYEYMPQATTSKWAEGIHLGFEYLPLNPAYGKLGVGASLQVSTTKDVVIVPGADKFSMTAFTTGLGVSYRFDYMERQPLVPFLKAGPQLGFANQTGRSGQSPYYGIEYGGGLEFCLNVLDPRSGRYLDQSTGINGVYVVLEYMKSSRLVSNDSPNLASEAYRVGLRFEL